MKLQLTSITFSGSKRREDHLNDPFVLLKLRLDGVQQWLVDLIASQSESCDRTVLLETLKNLVVSFGINELDVATGEIDLVNSLVQTHRLDQLKEDV